MGNGCVFYSNDKCDLCVPCSSSAARVWAALRWRRTLTTPAHRRRRPPRRRMFSGSSPGSSAATWRGPRLYPDTSTSCTCGRTCTRHDTRSGTTLLSPTWSCTPCTGTTNVTLRSTSRSVFCFWGAWYGVVSNIFTNPSILKVQIQ